MGSKCCSQRKYDQVPGKGERNVTPRAPTKYQKAQASKRGLLDPPEEVKDAFQRALDNGSLDGTAYLLDDYADTNLIQTTWPNGDRCLHRLIGKEKPDLGFMYSLIMEYNAQVNSPNALTGDTPLHLAVRLGHVRVVQMLLKKDNKRRIRYEANPDLKNNAGESSRRLAEQSSERRLWALLCPDKLVESDVFSSPVFEGREGDTRHLQQRSLEPSRSSSRENSPGRVPRGSSGESSPPPLHSVHSTPPEFVQSFDDDSTLEPVVQNVEVVADDVEIELAGFLDKGKKSLGQWTWQRRFVIVKGAYFLWSESEIEIEDVNDPQQRDQFNNHEHLSDIVNITKAKTDNRVFKVHVPQTRKEKKDRTYRFRANTIEDRDEWMKQLTRLIDRHERLQQ